MTAIIDQVASGTDRASEHLRRAWSKLYGRKPDLNTACLEAVAAIEVAAKPIVSPNNAKTTLGTIIRDMNAKPSKWVTDSEADVDVTKVITTMDLVWQGHYRHGDDTAPIDMTRPGAVMVVQLAAVLVGWFRAGYIRVA